MDRELVKKVELSLISISMMKRSSFWNSSERSINRGGINCSDVLVDGDE